MVLVLTTNVDVVDGETREGHPLVSPLSIPASTLDDDCQEGAESSDKKTESIALLSIALSFAAVLLMLGAGVSSLGLVLVWLAQCLLGLRVLRIAMPRNPDLVGALVAAGPGYLVGFLLTTWVFVLFRGGTPARIVLYAAFIWALVSLTRDVQFRSATWYQFGASAIALMSVALVGLTREFPELTITALGALVLAFALMPNRFGWRFNGAVAAVGAITSLVGISFLGEYWFLESDDLAHRMSMGALSVSQGAVGIAATFPVHRYHWVSPVGTALQADLAHAPILSTFTIASPIAAVLMLVSSFFLIVRLTRAEQMKGQRLLLAGTALVVLAKVRVDTEAVAGRLGVLVAVVGIVRIAQLWLLRNGVRTTDVMRLAIAFFVLSAMLVLYRPDLVVLLLLLVVGLVFSVVTPKDRSRFFVLVAISIAMISAGLLVLRLVLPKIMQLGASLGFLGVRWRPPDLGWCSRGSTLRDSLCVMSSDVWLWVAVTGIFVLLASGKHLSFRHVKFAQLLLPAILSYLPLRMTLTTNFPSAIDGFIEIALRCALVLVLVVILEASSSITGASVTLVLGFTALLATAQVALSSYLYDVLSSRHEGVVGRLQGIFTPSLFTWLLASTALGTSVMLLLTTRLRRYLSYGPLVLLAALTFVGVWSEIRGRTMTTDVNEQLVSEAIGPIDVFEMGEWLRTHTEKSELLATNYQCNPGRVERCSSVASEQDNTLPTGTANWMLMATSERDFLYLSQPWYSEQTFKGLADMSLKPGLELEPDFQQLEEEGVDLFVAFRENTQPEAWVRLQRRAVFITENFLAVRLNT